MIFEYPPFVTRWFILGFTADDVVTMEQDVRLARECVRAGAPATLDIRQGPGGGEHLLYWYVNEPAAAILDAHDVDWRRFVIGERPDEPADAHPVLKPEPH
jgi:hypothetical protein